MAMEVDVQRLELGDVVLLDLDDEAEPVEAEVVRAIDRTDTTVRVTLRTEGSTEDVIREWKLGEQVTVVRGP
jgi:tRNA G37 N-methylase Trm5